MDKPAQEERAWARWDAICITAPAPAHAEAYKRELQRRQSTNAASLVASSLILAISDPGEVSSSAGATQRIGSGGATLNALVLVAEHLSALAGDNSVDMSILMDRRVLVLHVGGSSQRIPAFSLLPTPSLKSQSTATGCAHSTIDLLLDSLTSLASGCPPGFFVVSSEDSFVHVGEGFQKRFAEAASRSLGEARGTATAVAASLPISDVAHRHGVYKLEKGGAVRRVLYRASEAELLAAKLPSATNSEEVARVAKVCGVVFFDEVAATRLLELAFKADFEPCSYLGIDNGAQPSGFSLFLDLLACLGTDVSFEEFARSTSFAGQVQVDAALRIQLWRQLHDQIQFKAVPVEPDDTAQYMSVRTAQDYARLVATLEEDVSGGDPGRSHDGSIVDSSAHVVNSIVTTCKVGPGAIIESSMMNDCTVEAGAVCSGLKRMKGLCVPCGLRLQQIALLNTSPGAAAATWDRDSFCVVTYRLEDEAPQLEADGTFLAQPWPVLLRRTGIVAADLWAENMPLASRTLQAAKLFPVVQDTHAGSLGMLWVDFAGLGQDLSRPACNVWFDLWRRRWLQVWRNAPRLSLNELLAHADVSVELEWQDTVAAETNVLRARQLLLHHRGESLWHVLDDEVRRQRWGLLDVFDDIAAAADTPLDVAARTLAHTAEVLAAFGGTEGGLRSGSARNLQWRSALARLASQDANDRRAAVLEMRILRSQWIGDGPVALIRAARHYEAAAQVLILMATATCSEFITITPALSPGPSNCWVEFEAPARIDLAGGWTDTPPVCYENGGVVVNLALLVDGNRPLGARARRLPNSPQFVFETRSERPPSEGDAAATAGGRAERIVCSSLADLEDHNSPSAPAALLKCCVLCCGIVSITASSPLSEQLLAAGGGLHLISWSSLPQGSGLGGSSILAGVAMRSILTAFGLAMDDESLIHAVLNVEQMLTTGGGWQDQVGAIIGGAKIARSAPKLPLQVVPEQLPMSQAFADELSSRLVLVFTGRPRLAKHLLQNVVRQWFSRLPEICSNVRDLVTNAEAAAEAIRAGNLEALGACMASYWEQKKVMAPGSEPRPVAVLRERLAPGLLGFLLAGAGGGGYAAMITREPNAHAWVREVVAGCHGLDGAFVSVPVVDFAGLSAA